MEIWTDILEAVRRAEHKPEAIPPSKIQTSVNVPHDRFWRHVADMENSGLVESTPLRATRQGEQFLQKTGTLRRFLNDEPRNG